MSKALLEQAGSFARLHSAPQGCAVRWLSRLPGTAGPSGRPALGLLAVLLVCLSVVRAAAAAEGLEVELTADAFRKRLRPHPRLVLTKDRLEALKEKIKQHDWARELESEIRAQTEEFAGNRRLPKNAPTWKQWNSRARHVRNAALLYRLHGDKKWLDQAIREMRVFLDEPHYRKRAEEGRGAGLPASSGVLGLALGYDWLYHDLPPALRKEVECFLVTCSFPTLYEDGKLRNFPDSNWRQVILGAHAIAALAVADAHPKRAAQVLADTLPQVAGVVSHYRPDGICPEGVHYWDFGMEFTAALCDSLETGLGTTFGLKDRPVLDATVRWRTAANTPVDGNFPYADGSRFNLSVLFMSYWANQTGLDWLVQREDLFHLIRDEFHRHAEAKNLTTRFELLAAAPAAANSDEKTHGFEAEDAVDGKTWRMHKDADASGGSRVARASLRDLSEPPSFDCLSRRRRLRCMGARDAGPVCCPVRAATLASGGGKGDPLVPPASAETCNLCKRTGTRRRRRC